MESQRSSALCLRCDETFHYVIEEKKSGGSSYGGKSFDLSTSLILDTTWKVEKVLPNGSVKLNVHIDRLRYTANGIGEVK